jgi:hypothetical protein
MAARHPVPEDHHASTKHASTNRQPFAVARFFTARHNKNRLNTIEILTGGIYQPCGLLHASSQVAPRRAAAGPSSRRLSKEITRRQQEKEV